MAQPRRPPPLPTRVQKNGLALGGIVLAILGVAMAILYAIVGVVLGVVGLVLSIAGRGRARETGIGWTQARAGIITSSIAIALGVTNMILVAVGVRLNL